jgi:hypothetical protein
VGTGVGGIIGPLLFGNLIDSGPAAVAIGFFIGAGVMALGGLAELAFGVRAERVSLENIAKPLTVTDTVDQPPPEAPVAEAKLSPERRATLERRERAEEERVRAEEHRATVHELRAGGDSSDHQRAEGVLADIADLRAQAFEEQAAAHDERANAEEADADGAHAAALERAEAAQERARAHEERAEALGSEHQTEAEMHVALAEAAAERARAHEQRGLAASARSDAGQEQAPDADVTRAQAETYDEWAQMHDERSRAQASLAGRDKREAARHDQEANAFQERALAAEDRVDAARHRATVVELQTEKGALAQAQQAREEEAARDREARERDERIRQRLRRQEARERSGFRRFLPGPSNVLYSPGMVSPPPPTAERDLDREIDAIARALDEHGPTNRDDLTQLVGARYWGPGRFRDALREAVEEGRAQRLSRTTFAPADESARSSRG